MNRDKLKQLFSRQTNWIEEVYQPVKSRFVKRKKKTLIGTEYHFLELLDQTVTSPLNGTISRIFPNCTLQIISWGGIQLLITVKPAEENYTLSEKDCCCQVQSGQKVDSQTVLFIIHQPPKVSSLTVYILWQPEILRKIVTVLNNRKNVFLNLYYHRPQKND